MSAPIVAAISSIFAPAGAAAGAGVAAGAAGAGAAAAGAAATFSSGFLGILGGALGGIGSGMMARQEQKDDEAARVAEEKRLQDSYAGAGQAMRFWEQDNPGSEDATNATNEFQRADANSNAQLRVGQQEQAIRPGEQYRNRTKQKPERFRYDRNSGQIVPS